MREGYSETTQADAMVQASTTLCSQSLDLQRNSREYESWLHITPILDARGTKSQSHQPEHAISHRYHLSGLRYLTSSTRTREKPEGNNCRGCKKGKESVVSPATKCSRPRRNYRHSG
jgi:hypothetical protein